MLRTKGLHVGLPRAQQKQQSIDNNSKLCSINVEDVPVVVEK